MDANRTGQLHVDERLSVGSSLAATVASVYGVGLGQLSIRTRGRSSTAFARQVAMYLTHVTCGLSLTEVGRLFMRDRTTVAHACQVVEGKRDEPLFDESMGLLEKVAAERLRRAGVDEIGLARS